LALVKGSLLPHDQLGNPIRVSGIQVDITVRKTQEEALRLNHAAIEAVQSGLVIADARADDMPIVYVNPAFEKITGYNTKEMLGQNCRFLNDKTTDRSQLDLLKKALAQGKPITLILHNKRKDGTYFWNELYISPVMNDQGSLTHFVGIQNDVSERVQASAQKESLLIKLKEQSSLLDKATDAIFVPDLSQKITYWNNSAFELFGWSEKEVMGKTIDHLINVNSDELKAANDCLSEFGEWRGELQKIKKSGEIIIVDAHWTLVNDDSGRPISTLVVNTDITQRKAVENRIKYIAYHDELTALPNRVSLMNHLETITQNANTSNSFSMTVMILDIDDFKKLNDTFGHFMGDLLLQEVARRLKACLMGNNFLARFGGDEYVLVLHDRSENFHLLKQFTELVAKNVLAAIHEPFNLENYEYFSSTSIGVSIVERGIIPSDLIKQADLALTEAKKTGKNKIQYFDENLQNQLLARTKIEFQLRRAILREEFELYLQPQVDKDSKVIGCEGLIRWHSETLGTVSPADFIPIAEESGLIIPIGDWVLETGCNILQEWHSISHLSHLSIAINVSAGQFKHVGFIDKCADLLNGFSFDRNNLKLELTESVLAEDKELIISQMLAIKKLGLRFSLDDFGTGYSSLSYLKYFPLSQLKIDQSFVRDILVDENDAAIARTIIRLADSLGLQVIAEGVETQEQKNILYEMGCEQYQGYLFSRPLPKNQIEDMLNDAHSKLSQ